MNSTTNFPASDDSTCSTRDLAARIATRLFTNGFGDQGERLEIKQAIGYEKERSLGGWCYLAALDQITAVIEENVPAMGAADTNTPKAQ